MRARAAAGSQAGAKATARWNAGARATARWNAGARAAARWNAGARAAAVAGVLAAVTVLLACQDSDGNTKAFCTQVRKVPVITDRDQLATPDATTATDELLRGLRQLRATAPTDIRRDVTVMVSVVEAVQRALVTPAGPERNDAINEIERLTPAWGDASTHVVSYTRRTCGFDLVTGG